VKYRVRLPRRRRSATFTRRGSRPPPCPSREPQRIAARDAVYLLDRNPDPHGFALRQNGRVVGHLPWHHQELVFALNYLDALARSPRALAEVLEASGASALAQVGALLARRSA